MKNIVIVIAGLVLLGCGGRVDMKVHRSSTELGTITDPNLREFRSKLLVDGTPYANIRCTYVGKKPEAPDENEIERDWAREDTDFYHYTISNVSNEAIEIEQIEYAFSGVPDEAVFRTDEREAIRRDLGATTILPGESATRRNSWVGGENGESRILKKTYHVRSGDRAIELYVNLRYGTETQSTKPDSKRRGFQAQVSVGRTPLASIRCTYLGTKPEEPVENEIERDWAKEDTDFYHYTISNVSSNAIELKRIEYALKAGRADGVFKTDDREAIQRELGTTTILPGESVTRRNSWVGGDGGRSQTIYKTYHVRCDNRDMKLYVHLTYRPDRK